MPRFVVIALASIAAAAACGAEPQSADTSGAKPLAQTPDTSTSVPPSAPLPMRIPISAVMAGLVNESSFEIFQSATADRELSDADWLRIGSAAIDLVGASTLVTLPGTGDEDAAWVSDQRWLQASADMQEAGMAVGRAANARDQAALQEATAQLAQSCQSCHIVFSPRLVATTTDASNSSQDEDEAPDP